MNIGVARGEIQIETGQAISSLNQFGSALQQASQMGMGAMQAQGIQIQQQGLALQQLGRVGVAAGAGMAAPFIGAAKAAIDFESQMAGVNAVMDLQGDQFQNLSDLASQLGQDTVFTGVEAGRAIETLGKAGLSYEQIVGGAAKASTDLAAAAETDVATAADAIAAGIQSFGLSGEEAVTVADAIAGAANSSLASMEDIARGFGNVGSTANLAGMDVYETAAALAVLTDRGQSGTDAATTLRTALQHLLAPTDKAQNLMNELGLETVDAAGQFVGLEPFARQLVQTFDELGIAEADQIEIMKKLAGQDGMRALVGMVDAVRKEYDDAAKGIDDYNSAVREQGAAERFAQERMDSTAGAIERLMGSISVLGERVGAPMLTAIRPVVEVLDRIVDAIANLPAPVLAAVAALGSLTAAFTLLGGAGLFAAGHVVEAIGRLTSVGVDVAAIATRVRLLIPAILAVTAAIAALGVAWENDFLGMRTTAENFFGGIRDAFNEGVEIAGKLDMSGISTQIYGVSEAIRSLGAEEFAQKIRIIAGAIDDFFKEREKLQDDIKKETPTWTSPQESDPILGDPKMGEDTLNFLENLTTNLEAGARAADKWIGRGNGLSNTLRKVNRGVEAFANEWERVDDLGAWGITSATSALSEFFNTIGMSNVGSFFSDLSAELVGFQWSVEQSIANGANPFSAAIAAMGQSIQNVTGLPVSEWFTNLALDIQAGTDAAHNMSLAGMNPLASALGGISVALNAMGLEGLASTFAAASRTVQAFGDAFELATSIGLNPFHAALAGLSEAFGVITGIDMTGLTSAILNLGNAFEDFIGAVTSGDWDTVGEMISDAINVEGVELKDWILNVGLPSFVQMVGNILGWIRDRIAEGIANLGEIAHDFKEWILNVALPFAGEVADGIKGWLESKITGALAAVGEVTREFINWVLNVALPWGGELLGNVAAWIEEKITGGLAAISGITREFINWVLNVAAPWAGELIGDVAGWVSEKITGGLAKVGEITREFINWTLNVAAPWAGEVIGNIASWIEEKITGGLAAVGAITREFVNWVLNVAAPWSGEMLGNVAGWIEEKITGGLAAIGQITREFINWVLNIMEPWSGKVADVSSWIGTKIQEAMPKAGEIVEDFKDWAVTIGIPEAENAIKVSADFAGELMAQLGTAISDAVSDINVGEALSGSFAAGTQVGAFVHKVVAALTELLNNVFGALADPGAWKNIAIGTAGIGAAFLTFVSGLLTGALSGQSVTTEEAFAPIRDFISSGLVKAVTDAFAGGVDYSLADPAGGLLPEDEGGISKKEFAPLAERFAKGLTDALSEFGTIEIENPFEGIGEKLQGFADTFVRTIQQIGTGIDIELRELALKIAESINAVGGLIGLEPINIDEANAIIQSLKVRANELHLEGGGDPENVPYPEVINAEAPGANVEINGPIEAHITPGQDVTIGMDEAGQYVVNEAPGEVQIPANISQQITGLIEAGLLEEKPSGEIVIPGTNIELKLDTTSLGTNGEAIVSNIDEEFEALMRDAAMPRTQNGLNSALMKNFQQALNTAGIGGAGGANLEGNALIKGIDNLLSGVFNDASPSDMPSLGNALGGLIQKGLEFISGKGSTEGAEAGTIGNQVMTSLAEQISGADTAPVQQILKQKIGEALVAGMAAPSGGETSTEGASGIGTAVATSLAEAISTATFTEVGTAINTKIGEALTSGVSQSSGNAGEAAGAAAGGIGASLVTALATQIGSADFAAVGSAISTKISAALATGMTTAGGQAGGAGAAGGAGGGIGTAIANSLVSAVEGADFSAIGQTISTKLGEALQNVEGEGLGAALQGVFDKLAADAASMASSLQPVGAALIEGIAAGTGSAAGVLQSAVAAVISATVSSASGVASSSTPPVGTAFVTGAASGVGPATGTFQSAVDAMIQAAVASGSATATSSAVAVGAGFATGSGTGIGENTSILQDAVGAMINAAVASGVDVAESQAPAIGAAIAAGAAAGVRENAAQVAAEAAAMVTAAIEAANSAAAISSPSRVFMEIGGYMAEGTAVGIREKTRDVADAARNMVQRAIRETEGLRDINKEVGGNVKGVNAELKSIEEIAGILENAPGWNDFGSILRSSSAGIKDSVGAIREDVKDLVRSVKEQLKDMVHQFREAGKQSGSAIGEGIASGAGGAGSGIGGSIEKTLNSEMANINLDQLVIGRDMFKSAKQGIGELKGVGGELNNILQIAEILENAPGWNDFGAMLRESAGNIQGDVGGARDKFRDIMKEMNQISRDQAKAMKEIMRELAATIGDLASKVGESAGSGMSSGMSKGQESAETAGSDMAYGSVGAIESTIENLKGNLSNVGMGAGQALGGGMQKTASEMTEIGNEVGTALGDGATQGLQDSVEGGSEIAETAGDSLGSSFNSGVAGTIPDAMQLGSQISNSVLEALRASAIGDTEAVRMIGDAFGRAFGQGISSATPEAVQAGKSLTDATETGMVAGAPSAEGTATGVGKDIGSSLGDGIEDACKPVNTAARDITRECAGGGIESAEGNAVKTAERAGENIGEAVGDGMSDAGRDVEREGKSLGLDAVNSVKDSIDANATKMKSSVTTMVNKAKVDPTADAKPVGTNFVLGMIDGLNNKKGDLYNKVIEIVNDAIDKANTEAKNASPSKRMIEWGQNVGDGMVVGLASKGDPLVDTMVSMVESVVDAAQIGEVSVGTFTMDAVGQNMKWAASQVNSLLDRGTSERMRALEAYASNKSGKQSASKSSSGPTIQVGDIILKEGDPLYDQAKSFFGSVAAQHIPYYGSSRRS